MKIHVIGKAHLQGSSKKTGNPIQLHSDPLQRPCPERGRAGGDASFLVSHYGPV